MNTKYHILFPDGARFMLTLTDALCLLANAVNQYAFEMVIHTIGEQIFAH